MSTTFTHILSRFESLVLDGVWSENIHQMLNNAPFDESVYSLITDGEIDGTKKFSDINYTNFDPAAWDSVKHITRMLWLLRRYGRERLTADNEYAAVMIGLFEHWVKRAPQNPNWWYNLIGTPRAVADIALMLMPVLKADTVARAVDIVAWGSMLTEPERIDKMTGANLVWCATTTIKHAILTDNEELLIRAVKRVEAEIEVAREGIQEDGSFFQHGRRLYSGGYGRSFAYEMAQLLYALDGTEYQLPQAKIELYLTHILDGLRYMTMHNALDCAIIGREINRVSALRPGILRTAVEMLTRTSDVPRQDELRAYLGELDGKAEFIGTKYFHCPKLLCHHIPGLYVGVKNTDNTLYDMEHGNGEGRLNLNMSYGTHCSIMRTGEEYVNLIPTYDAAHIPGTTARLETDDELIAHGQEWSRTMLDSDVSGGAQSTVNPKRAAMYELARHDGVETLFTCFSYEDGMIFMGTAISDAKYDAKHPLTTTLDQSRHAGKVTVSKNGSSVVHNGIRYTRLAGPQLKVRTEKRTGSWYRNNLSRPDVPQTDNIFTIWMDHSGAVGTPYAYVITPESTVPAVEVVCNDAAEQSVRLSDGSVMAVRFGKEKIEVTV